MGTASTGTLLNFKRKDKKPLIITFYFILRLNVKQLLPESVDFERCDLCP